jgi:hypothetical protein
MRKVALFVGIDHYKDTAASQLEGAANDAERLFSTFTAAGFETELLTDRHLKQSGVINEFLQSLTSNLGAGDLFVFYFAGHGKTVPIWGPTGRLPDQQVCVLPHADIHALEAGVIGDGVLPHDLVEKQTSKGGLQRLFVFDACRDFLRAPHARGGGVQESGFAGEGATRNLVTAAGKKGRAGLTVLNSCKNGNLAREIKGRRRGLFSAALESLLKESLKNRNRLAVDGNLLSALTERMRTLADAAGLDPAGQEPDLESVKGQGPLCLYEPESDPGAALRREKLIKLREEFERHLREGRLDEPRRDCAQSTLDRLDEHLDKPAIQALEARLASAVDERRVAAEKQRQEAEGLAADRQRAATAFEAAVAAGTAQAWQDFLREFEGAAGVDAAWLAQARNWLEEEQRRAAEEAARLKDLQEQVASIAAARAAASREAYLGYLERWPQGEYAAEARAALDLIDRDDAAYEAAKRAATEPALEAYLLEFDPGRHGLQARQQLAELRDEALWRGALEGGGIEDFERYEAHAPLKLHLTECRAKLVALRTEREVEVAAAAELERTRKQRAEQRALDDALWAKARASGLFEDYEAYRDNGPLQQHEAECREEMLRLRRERDEEQEWSRLRAEGTEEELRQFLQLRGDSRFAGAARERLEALVAERVRLERKRELRTEFEQCLRDGRLDDADRRCARDVLADLGDVLHAATIAEMQARLTAALDERRAADERERARQQAATAYQAALESNTVEAWESFSSKYAAHATDVEVRKLLAEARRRREAVRNRAAAEAARRQDRHDQAAAVAVARAAATREAWAEYLRRWPKGEYAEEARTALARMESDDEAYAAARAAGTVEAMEAYLRDFEPCRHEAEAKSLLATWRTTAAEETAWQRALAENSAKAYRAYLDGFPHGPNAPLAKEQLAQIETKTIDPAVNGEPESDKGRKPRWLGFAAFVAVTGVALAVGFSLTRPQPIFRMPDPPNGSDRPPQEEVAPPPAPTLDRAGYLSLRPQMVGWLRSVEIDGANKSTAPVGFDDWFAKAQGLAKAGDALAALDVARREAMADNRRAALGWYFNSWVRASPDLAPLKAAGESTSAISQYVTGLLIEELRRNRDGWRSFADTLSKAPVLAMPGDVWLGLIAECANDGAGVEAARAAYERVLTHRAPTKDESEDYFVANYATPRLSLLKQGKSCRNS